MSPRDERLADRVWALMSGIYGSQWTARYPTDDLRALGRVAYAAALRHKTTDALRRGAEHMTRHAPDFPPTAAAFADLCTTPPAMYTEHARQLRHKAHPDVVEKQVDVMRDQAKTGNTGRPWVERLAERDQDDYQQRVRAHRALVRGS